MSTPPLPPSASPEPTEPDAIRRDIEETREQLADTVDRLAARLDVKSRAADRVHEVRGQATERVQEVRRQAVSGVQEARTRAQQTWTEHQQAVIAAAAAAAAAVAVVLVARRRS